MRTDASQNVTASHLKRDASLSVRQSTGRQVFEHTESTQRQDGLRQRAIALTLIRPSLPQRRREVSSPASSLNR